MVSIEKNKYRPDLLKKIRNKSGLSRKGLALRANLSPAAISLLELGQREPKLSTALAISDALNISVYAFCESISIAREIDCRSEIERVVVENDLPEYEDTWQSIATCVVHRGRVPYCHI